MPAKIERKILAAGDSKTCALPPDWLRIFKLGLGDTVDVLYDTIVIVKPKNFNLDPEFLKREFDLILQLEAEGKQNVK